MAFNIVLVEPEIPQNTGNIARTCAATGARLHLVKPLGFAIDDKSLKRAGLDYWHLLDVTVYENLADFFERNKGGNMWYLTTKGAKRYDQTEFKDNDYFIFGKETKGLPEELLHLGKPKWPVFCFINKNEILSFSSILYITAPHDFSFFISSILFPQ